MKVYRVYAPCHTIFASGSMDGGVFATEEKALKRLVALTAELSERREIQTAWRGPRSVVVTMTDTAGATSLRYMIREYDLDAPIHDDVPGYPARGGHYA